MVRAWPLLLLMLLTAARVAGQAPAMNEAAAKEAVYRIVQHSGLLPTFTVREDAQVRTANAYIKGHERVIAYNPGFMARILDSTRTDWSAVSVLAHEIAHHLLGHTLDPDAMHPGDELACDRYSGFILHRMGATLEESLAAMEVAGNVHGTRSHPPKHARLAAIRQGWEEAGRLSVPGDRLTFTFVNDLTHVVRFAGDANTYYINARQELVWFDQYADPIAFGRLENAAGTAYPFTLTWQDQRYRVDGGGTIWSMGANGMDRQVGRMEPFVAPQRQGR
ncbi:MAG: M48 family metalloprotease [Flavobacteriales bacterium]|nr:M48 family metalloprotease [Flavobacteriales bacterium]